MSNDDKDMFMSTFASKDAALAVVMDLIREELKRPTMISLRNAREWSVPFTAMQGDLFQFLTNYSNVLFSRQQAEKNTQENVSRNKLVNAHIEHGDDNKPRIVIETED